MHYNNSWSEVSEQSTVADKGIHNFSYALYPHDGTLQDGDVVEEAYAFNVPLVVEEVEKQEGDLEPIKSFFSVDKPGVFIEAVKKAEKSDDTVLRLYEGHSTRGDFQLTSSLNYASTQPASMMEDAEGDSLGQNEVVDSITPFEIKTYLMKK